VTGKIGGILPFLENGHPSNQLVQVTGGYEYDFTVIAADVDILYTAR